MRHNLWSLLLGTASAYHASVGPLPTKATQRSGPVTLQITLRDYRDSPVGQQRRARGTAVFTPVSLLCSEGILSPDTPQGLQQLAGALQRDLVVHFTDRNRLSNALLLAEDESSGELVGCCGIEVARLSDAVLDDQRAAAAGDTTYERPLLSNLAVSGSYRKKGIATRLCREAEAAACSWGYDEVVLRVEQDNKRARRLYRSLGYRALTVDRKAEKPAPGPGGIKFVPTTQICMRKDLRYPPLDVVVGSIALLVGVAALASQPEAAAELARGAIDAAMAAAR